MDARTRSALDLGWRLVAATLARLGALAGRGWLAGPAWVRAFAELRRAEAAARRLLVVLAGGVPAQAMPAVGQVRVGGWARRESASVTPGFALFDAFAEHRFKSDGAAGGPADPATAFHSTAGLAARLKALAELAGNPAPAIRRMALWLARGRAARTSPLRPGRPPGVGAGLVDLEQDVVMQCDACARERLNRPVPP